MPKNQTFPYWIVAVFLFFPCLVLGRAYFDDDLLLQYGIDQVFLKKCLVEGHLPLWNPYVYAGQPFWGDPNAMTAYPLLYLDFILPRANGFGLFYFLHFVVAATGMHFWLKSLGLSKESCWIGAFSFSLSGFFWCEVIHPPILAAFAWLPWFFGWLERMASAPSRPAAFLSGSCFALLFLAGSFQVTLGTLYAAVPYFFLRAGFFRGWGKKIQRSRRTGTAVFLLLFFLGSLPLLGLWLPFSEFVRFSDRPHVHLGYEAFNADISLDLPRLVQLVLPIDPWDPSRTKAVPYENYLPNAGYLGIWAFFLIPWAFMGKGRRPVLFLSAAALLGLGIALGRNFPLHRWLCDGAPGFHLLRAPIRFLFLYVMGSSALLAFGFERLMDPKGPPRKYPVPTSLAALAYVLVLTGVWRFDIFQSLFLGIGLAGLMLWVWISRWREVGKWIFLISILLPLFQNGQRLCPSRLGPASNFQFEKQSALMSGIRGLSGNGRIFIGDNIPYEVEFGGKAVTAEFPADAACLFGLKNVGGYGALSFLKRGQLHTLPFPTFLRLMAVQGFVTGNDNGKVSGFDLTEWGPVRFYRNQGKPPLVYAPKRLETIVDDEQALEAMRSPSFDPNGTAYLSEPPSTGPPGLSKDGDTRLDYRLLTEGLDDQSFEVERDRSGWVVFSEVDYPGWRARVDDVPAPIVTSNYLFRGLYLPQGRHRVDFEFQPNCIGLVFFLGLLWIGTMGFWFLGKVLPQRS